MLEEVRSTPVRHLIIGGTIKGATTSVFDYLSAHPEVCGSSVKETFFFTQHYSGKREQDIKNYRKYFSESFGSKVWVEASPNYLAFKRKVAPCIHSLLPDARMLFILRNPVDRFYSHYNFARGKLELPENITFEQYFELCQQYSCGNLTVEQAGIAEKHLRALEIGNYAKYLYNYFEILPRANIRVVFFEDLKADPVLFMVGICKYAGIHPSFFSNYEFKQSNVTYSARFKPLHFIVIRLNRMLESTLRQHPQVKTKLVALYKKFNQNEQGYKRMEGETRRRVSQYYKPYNTELKILLESKNVPSWLD